MKLKLILPILFFTVLSASFIENDDNGNFYLGNRSTLLVDVNGELISSDFMELIGFSLNGNEINYKGEKVTIKSALSIINKDLELYRFFYMAFEKISYLDRYLDNTEIFYKEDIDYIVDNVVLIETFINFFRKKVFQNSHRIIMEELIEYFSDLTLFIKEEIVDKHLSSREIIDIDRDEEVGPIKDEDSGTFRDVEEKTGDSGIDLLKLRFKVKDLKNKFFLKVSKFFAKKTPIQDVLTSKNLYKPLMTFGIETYEDLQKFLKKSNLRAIPDIGFSRSEEILKRIGSYSKKGPEFSDLEDIKESVKEDKIQPEIDLRQINSGIINPGNRCYLLSLLQCLSQIEGFAIPNFDFDILKTSKSPINLSEDFLRYISELLFERSFSESGTQQDAAALYVRLIDKIGFNGSSVTVQEVLKNLNKNDTRKREVSESVIYLSLSDVVNSVQGLLNNYFINKELLKDYSWNNDKNYDISVEKSFKLIGSSDYLVLSLKIFDEKGQKLFVNAKIEESINFGEQSYEVSGIVLHLGRNIESGHYISIIKQNGSYYVYNDSNVSGPFDDLGGALSSVSNFDPYMLFYKRV